MINPDFEENEEVPNVEWCFNHQEIVRLWGFHGMSEVFMTFFQGLASSKTKGGPYPVDGLEKCCMMLPHAGGFKYLR